LRLIHGARAHIDAYVRLGPHLFTKGHELVGAEEVWFLNMPGELHFSRSALFRANAVDPVVTRHEVPARVSQHGWLQPAYCLDHVLAEAALVGKR
jgi:hypothetical protein